jgi:hypothetical protein
MGGDDLIQSTTASSSSSAVGCHGPSHAPTSMPWNRARKRRAAQDGDLVNGCWR